MHLKQIIVPCFIAIALLTSCASKSQLHESLSDTLVTVAPDTTIDPITGLRPGEYIDPASLPKVYATFDSVQEFNIVEGIFKDGSSPIDTAVKMYFYASDFYSEPLIKEGNSPLYFHNLQKTILSIIASTV
jgi:hypothetical protein